MPLLPIEHKESAEQTISKVACILH